MDGPTLTKRVFTPLVAVAIGFLTLPISSEAVGAGFFGFSDQTIIDGGGSVSEVGLNWRIVCFQEGQDRYGRVTAHKHCRIDNRDVEGIAVIQASGLSASLLPSRPVCGGYKGRIWVDGIAIDKTPASKGVMIMSRGRMLSRSYQTAWPECRTYIQYAGLGTFASALRQLRADWRRFR